MKCQRCIEAEEATHRVYSDVMELRVCSACAAEAAILRLGIELLPRNEEKEDSADNEFSGSGREMLVVSDSSALAELPR